MLIPYKHYLSNRKKTVWNFMLINCSMGVITLKVAGCLMLDARYWINPRYPASDLFIQNPVSGILNLVYGEWHPSWHRGTRCNPISNNTHSSRSKNRTSWCRWSRKRRQCDDQGQECSRHHHRCCDPHVLQHLTRRARVAETGADCMGPPSIRGDRPGADEAGHREVVLSGEASAMNGSRTS